MCKDSAESRIQPVPCRNAQGSPQDSLAEVCLVTVCEQGCAGLHYGTHCLTQVTCNLEHGNCDRDDETSCSGVEAAGTCSSCKPGWYGPNCELATTCNEDNGTCDASVCHSTSSNGGGCTTCNQNYFGRNCDQQVTCSKTNGVCDQGSCYGPGGNGHCSRQCTEGMGGKDCTCELNGDGDETPCCNPFGSTSQDPVEGECSCRPGFLSARCNLIETLDIEKPEFLHTCVGDAGIMTETYRRICDDAVTEVDFKRVACAGIMMNHGDTMLADWGFTMLSKMLECQQEERYYKKELSFAIEQTASYLLTQSLPEYQTSRLLAELEITAMHLRIYQPSNGPHVVSTRVANGDLLDDEVETENAVQDGSTFEPVLLFRSTARSQLEATSCYLPPCPCGTMPTKISLQEVADVNNYHHCIAVENGPQQELEVYSSYTRCGMVDRKVASLHTFLPREVYMTRAAYCLRGLESKIGTQDGDFGVGGEVHFAYVDLLNVVRHNLESDDHSTDRLSALYAIVERQLQGYRERFPGDLPRQAALSQIVPPYGLEWYDDQLHKMVSKLRDLSVDMRNKFYSSMLQDEITKSTAQLTQLVKDVDANTQGALQDLSAKLTEEFGAVHSEFQQNARAMLDVAESERRMLEDEYEAEKRRVIQSGIDVTRLNKVFKVVVENVAESAKEVLSKRRDVEQAQIELQYVKDRTVDVMQAFGALFSIGAMFSPALLPLSIGANLAASRRLRPAHRELLEQEASFDTTLEQLAREQYENDKSFSVEAWKLFILSGAMKIDLEADLLTSLKDLQAQGISFDDTDTPEQIASRNVKQVETVIDAMLISNSGRLIPLDGAAPHLLQQTGPQNSENSETSSKRRLWGVSRTKKILPRICEVRGTLSTLRNLAQNSPNLVPKEKLKKMKDFGKNMFSRKKLVGVTYFLATALATFGINKVAEAIIDETMADIPFLPSGLIHPPTWSGNCVEPGNNPDGVKVGCYECLETKAYPCLNIKFPLNQYRAYYERYLGEDQEFPLEWKKGQDINRDYWIPTCASNRDIFNLLKTNIPEYADLTFDGFFAESEQQDGTLRTLRSQVCDVWKAAPLMVFNPNSRRLESAEVHNPRDLKIQTKVPNLPQCTGCGAVCTNPSGISNGVSNANAKSQSYMSRIKANRGKIAGGTALVASVFTGMFAIGTYSQQEQAQSKAEDSLSQLETSFKQHEASTVDRLKVLREELQRPFSHLSEMVTTLKFMLEEQELGDSLRVSSPVTSYDAAALWESTYHSILNLLEYELGICPRTAPLQVDESGGRRLRQTAQTPASLHNRRTLGSAPEPSHLSESVKKKEYTTQDAFDKLDEETQEFRAALAEQEASCQRFRATFRELSIWARSFHEGIIKMTNLVRNHAHVSDKEKIFQKRVQSAKETVVQSLLDADHIRNSPLRQLPTEKTVQTLQGVNVAVHQSLMEEEVLNVLDVATGTLNSFCNAHAYVNPKDFEKMSEICSYSDLTRDPADAFVAISDQLLAVERTMEESWNDLVYSKKVTSSLDFLDITEMIDLEYHQERFFLEPIKFSLQGPFGGRSVPGGKQSTASFHRGGPFFCKNDNVELHELGLLFLDDNGTVIGPPPATTVSSLRQVSMDITLSGPFIKTLQGEEFVYEMKPFENIPFSYMLPGKDNTCGFSDSDPFFQNQACPGRTTQSIVNLRPSPYAVWSVQVTEGQRFLKEAKRVVLLAKYSAIKNSDMVCRPDYSANMISSPSTTSPIGENKMNFTWLIAGLSAIAVIAALGMLWKYRQTASISSIGSRLSKGGDEETSLSATNPQYSSKSIA